jgi:AmmeMemoRadiSam system protein B
MSAAEGLVRKPAVAGSFYPADEGALRSLIRHCYLDRLGPGRLPFRPGGRAMEERDGDGMLQLKACVCPHAGYVYSGAVSAHSYLDISEMGDAISLAIVVGPDHYGIGSGIATYTGGGLWETPLGRVLVDEAASGRMVELTGSVDIDNSAHAKEHSIEVQVPFLQDIYGAAFTLLPISLTFQDKSTARDLGKGLAELVKEEADSKRKVVLIASSDLTHYEPALQARRKDTALLGCIQDLDLDGFYTTLERENITACGYGAIGSVMEACKLAGLGKGRLNAYATSGDVTGETDAVVGYPSVTFVEGRG